MLFIGDDWAEGHHDVVIQDEAGKTLARRRLPEGADGIARFHELVASCWGEHSEPDLARVVVVIETDRGPWVKALAAAGYRVYAVNPKQAARHKETIAMSGKKDGFFDAAGLADMGRTRRHQIRELAADSDIAEAVKIAARAHQKLVWERTRHLLRTRSALREYFPAALEAYAGLTLTGADTLELLGKAPDPDSAAKLTVTQITRRAQAGRAARRPGRPGPGHPGRAAHPAPGPARRHRRGVRRVGADRSRREAAPHAEPLPAVQGVLQRADLASGADPLGRRGGLAFLREEHLRGPPWPGLTGPPAGAAGSYC